MKVSLRTQENSGRACEFVDADVLHVSAGRVRHGVFLEDSAIDPDCFCAPGISQPSLDSLMSFSVGLSVGCRALG